MSDEPFLKNSADRMTVVAWVAAFAVASYFLAPLLRFADPSAAAETGALAGMTVALAYYTMWHRGEGRPSLPLWNLVTGIFAVAMIYSLHNLANDANVSAEANKRRCLALQRDMLSARPRRTDSRDLFGALKCEPQGEGSVYAPLRVKPVAVPALAAPARAAVH